MQIALLDFPAALPHARALSFAEPAPLDDVDLLVWHPAAIAALYGGTAGAVVETREAQQLVRHTRAWRDALRTFLERGGTLVVTMPPAAPLRLHTVQDIVDHDPLQALPMAEGLRREALDGEAVTCGHGEPFRSFFAAHATAFQATGHLRWTDAQPIAEAADSQAPCALYRYRHPGRLLILPSLTPQLPPARAQALVHAIAGMAARLRSESRTPFAYPWAERPALPGEDALRSRAAALAHARRGLEQQEEEVAEALRAMDFLRLLVCGDTVGVVDAAAHVLHALGAYVQKGLRDMDMVMFEHRGSFGVLVLVDDAELALGDDLPGHVRRQAALWRVELHAEVQAIGLYIGGHRRGAAATEAELQDLRTRHPDLPWCSGAELLQAYHAKDADWMARAGDA